MVGLLLLKRMFNQSDESVIERWIENPYWQYFTGEEFFQYEKPFDPSDFVHFRKRIEASGMEKVLSLSIKLHPGSEQDKCVAIDPTVQEKHITFPTDTKLQKKIIEHCREIAKEEGIELRQSYKRKLKQYLLDQRNSQHPKRRKKAMGARRKIKTIAGRLVRELERKLDSKRKEHYEELLKLFNQVLSQKRKDKNKVYSLHEPHVNCISKGKAHKKYEFGSKVAVCWSLDSGVIVGMTNFKENVYDGHTLAPALDQCERVLKDAGGKRPLTAVVDRGCRGKKEIEGTAIEIPSRAKAKATAYQKRKARKLFRQRAGIEPIISHLKQDHRMLLNYLKGNIGDEINALMAGAAFNFKRRLNQIKVKLKKQNILTLIQNLIETYFRFRLRQILTF